MGLFGKLPIYWGEQCKQCKNFNKTQDCERNQKFIEKLKTMYFEYIGSCEFKCDHFEYKEEKPKTKFNFTWEK